MEILSSIELIRKRPDLFFENVTPTQSELIRAVIADIAAISINRPEIENSEFWVRIQSEVDWMGKVGYNVPTLFEHFHAIGPTRPNSHRSEVLLAAVCDAIWTSGPGGNYSKGEILASPFELKAPSGQGRVLIWRLNPAMGVCGEPAIR